MKIPLVITSSLWHIGDLQNNTQGQRQSFEGNLLSASACPNAWMGIARLGGGKYYSLEHETFLLNLTEALHDDQCQHLRLVVEKWATEQRYIKQGTIYVVPYEDCEADEADSLREMHFCNEEEALAEADGYGVEVEARSTLLATQLLLKLHGLSDDSASSGLEFAMIEWARQNLQQSMVRGVYWDERLDELALSAPRAGLFSAQGLVERESLPDDEDCMQKVDFLTMERYALGARRVSLDLEPGR